MHHRSDQLCFLLLRGRTELRPLRIFDSRRIVWRGREVIFYVLGASHAVSVETRARVPVFEVLTCVPVAGHSEVLASSPVHSLHTVSTIVDDVVYRCELAPFDLAYWTDCFASAYPASDQMRFAYEPEPAVPAPLTCVAWRAEDGLFIETVHTYPHEGRGVRSRSWISLLADAP